MQRQLDAFNLNYQFIDAVDKHELYSEEYRAITANQAGISKPEIEDLYKNRVTRRLACQLSHLKVYNLMIKNKIPVICVLEDDGKLLPSFPKILAAAQKISWDILLLSHYHHSYEKGIFDNVSFAKKPLRFFYRLIRYKKYYPLLHSSYIIHLLITKAKYFILRHCGYAKYNYLLSIGGIPDKEKSMWHKTVSNRYIAKTLWPYCDNSIIGSAMGYLLTSSAAMKWKQMILRIDRPMDYIPTYLHNEKKINLYLLTPPCILVPINYYSKYSSRDM